MRMAARRKTAASPLPIKILFLKYFQNVKDQFLTNLDESGATEETKVPLEQTAMEES